MVKGALGDGVREGTNGDLDRSDRVLLVVDETSSLVVDGLREEAGKSGRDEASRLIGTPKYPLHWRPLEMHLVHAGRVSSHFTRLVLQGIRICLDSIS